jgi:spore maturation protein CgeB
LKILFVNSGGPGFSGRYDFDIFITLIRDFKYNARQVSPQQLTQKEINSFQPDLLLVMHGTFTPLPIVRYAKSLGVVTVLWLVEDPYEIDNHRGEMVNAYDYVFTNERQAVKEYTRPNVFHLPWSCNPKVHRRIKVPPMYQSDVCFVGMGFANRVRILNAIAPSLSGLNVKLIGDWQSWGEELHPSLKCFITPVINDFLEVQKYYNGAKINLNIHRDPINPQYGNRMGVDATSPNDRTFALAGCGAFQIVDRTRPDLWQYFSNKTEVVGFNNPDDLMKKIQYYLANPQLRENIRKSAQRKAYSQHTFRHRLAEIFRIISKSIYLSANNNAIARNNRGIAFQSSSFRPTVVSSSQYSSRKSSKS